MTTSTARRLKDLDRFLSNVEFDDDVMLLSELDGFLAGIAVCPELITPGEWLPVIWGDGGAPFKNESQAQGVLDLIIGHYNHILRTLGRPGAYEPILDQDRDGSLLWELWASGFRKAVFLNRGAWIKFTDTDDTEIRRALFSLINIGEIADGESNRSPDLEAVLQEHGIELIGESVETLHGARLALHPTPGPSAPTSKPPGRNDPCPCGSGKKFKKCCLN
jgi:uncharacterized protein